MQFGAAIGMDTHDRGAIRCRIHRASGNAQGEPLGATGRQRHRRDIADRCSWPRCEQFTEQKTHARADGQIDQRTQISLPSGVIVTHDGLVQKFVCVVATVLLLASMMLIMNSHDDFRDSRGLLYCAAILTLVTASISSAWAQQRIVSDPPLLDVKKGTAPRTTLMALPLGAPRMASEKQLDLNIEFTESKIYNPASGRYDTVRLRSYTGASVDPKAPHVAPTIEVYPGDTMRISLHNKLPRDPSCTAHQTDPTPDQGVDAINKPHCVNGTNLHAHGLWVSPSGNSDNVLLSINPGVDFQYEYNIPPDHPAGTFWYHTHRHGSTALQVASGMVGALVVRGDRLPSADGHGDIDTLLKNADGSAFTERLLVLQQIQYACRDNGVLKSRKVGDKIVEWICDPNDVGGVEGYVDAANNSLFGSSSWGQSGRYTSINSQVLPTFVAKAGEVERWRVIHAGVHDTIALQSAALRSQVHRSQADAWHGRSMDADFAPRRPSVSYPRESIPSGKDSRSERQGCQCSRRDR